MQDISQPFLPSEVMLSVGNLSSVSAKVGSVMVFNKVSESFGFKIANNGRMRCSWFERDIDVL